MIWSASQECFSMSIIERRRMLSTGLYCAMTILTLSAGMQPATARALIGAAAPAFTLTDSNGRNLSLADFKGKTVVLEWTSHECPYVGKHYRGNSMQALQKKWTGQGVVWLSVISSAPGQPGYVSPQLGEQAHGRSGCGAHCGAVRPHGRSRARLRRPHHPAYVRDQRRRSARLPRRHRRQAHGAARGPEERQEFCRPGAERDLAGQAGVRHHVARLRLLDQIWVVQRWDFAKIRPTGLELTHRRERFETLPTALELPQLCIGLHRLLSSQCHLSSVVAWRSVAIYEHAPSRLIQSDCRV